MNSWHSYPSIFAIGHKALESLFDCDVLVEEKIDGSQFSFGVTEDGELRVRSKGAVMLADAPEKMFQKAVDSVRERLHLLTPGYTYRGEYLMKPKHNTLPYTRIPNGHVMIFDVNTGHEEYMLRADKEAEATRIGLECVPLIFRGRINRLDEFRAFLDTDSVLGGNKVEGVVVKPADYRMYGADKKTLMGKFVSEAFKESHTKAWKESNPNKGDILEKLKVDYHSSARWAKAMQHLRDAGSLEQSPRDIPALLKEVSTDIHKECADEIKDVLFKWAWPQIQRAATRGLPEWYKEELVKRQFSGEEVA